MKHYLVLSSFLALILFSTACKQEDPCEHTGTTEAPIPISYQDLLYQPGSYWVYGTSAGTDDTIRLVGTTTITASFDAPNDESDNGFCNWNVTCTELQMQSSSRTFSLFVYDNAISIDPPTTDYFSRTTMLNLNTEEIGFPFFIGNQQFNNCKQTFWNGQSIIFDPAAGILLIDDPGSTGDFIAGGTYQLQSWNIVQ